MVILKKNVERSFKDKEYDYYFMNTSKYHYIAVTKPNTLLAKPLSNHDGHRFYLNCFCNFQKDGKRNKHRLFCKGVTHI